MLQVKRTFLCCGHKHIYWTYRFPSANLCSWLLSKLVTLDRYVLVIHSPSLLLPLAPPSEQTYHPLNKLLMLVSELPFCSKWHANPKLAITCGFYEGLKTLPVSESLAKTRKSRTTAQRAVSWRWIWGWERLDELCGLLPASCYRECGNTFLNNKFKFSGSNIQATGANVPLYINTGELLPLKT